MYKDKKIVVVMPAYNAAQTLRRTYEEVMEQGIVDLVIVVDDASHDETAKIAMQLPDTIVHVHESNMGYGANQKSCYQLALREGGDIIIMEISCPTKYFEEASSINFRRSLKYGVECMLTALKFRLSKTGLISSPLFPPNV